MPTLFDQVQAEFADIIRLARARAEDGLTLAELYALVLDSLESFMRVVELLQAPGAAKKQLVVDAVVALWDAVSPVVWLPYVPWGFQNWVKSRVRQALPGLVDRVIESLFRMVIAPARGPR